MADQRWSAQKNIQFIKEYSRNKCLWDPKHPQYKNRDAREAAYNEIMVSMEMDDFRDVITKIRVLRNTYNNETMKMKKSMATNTPYVSKIPWLPYMKFLKNYDYSKDNSDSAPNIPEQSLSEANTMEHTLPSTLTGKGIKRKIDHRWSADENIEFIKHYYRNECLWDPKHSQYKNRYAREAAYKEIMDAMDMESVRDVVTKIRTLRNTYNNQTLKAKKNMGTDTPYVSRIPWLPYMDFLKNIDDLRDNTEVPPNDSEEAVSNSPEFNAEEFITPHSPGSDKSTGKEIKAIKTSIGTLKQVLPNFSNAGRNDEFDLFGQTVAEQLRQMPLEFALETEEMVLATIRKQRLRVLQMQKPVCQHDPLASEGIGSNMNTTVSGERASSSDEEESPTGENGNITSQACSDNGIKKEDSFDYNSS